MRTARTFAAAAAVGAGAILAVVAILWGSGALYRTQAGVPAGWEVVAGTVGPLIATVLLQGVLLRLVMRGAGAAWALGVTLVAAGCLYALLSLAFTPRIITQTLFVLVQALLYLRTGRLPAPLGLALGWCGAAAGALGGYTDDGTLDSTESLFYPVAEGRAPLSWAGGSYGPEASVCAMLVLGLGVVFLSYRFRFAPQFGSPPSLT